MVDNEMYNTSEPGHGIISIRWLGDKNIVLSSLSLSCDDFHRGLLPKCYHKIMKIFGSLLTMFIVVPIVEFALLIEIGRRLGTIETLLLIFGTGVLGAFLARLEGFRILHRIQRDFQAGILPAEQVFDGVLVLIAGVVLITPGLLTDIAGLLLLFPPTRYPVKRFIQRKAQNWISNHQLHVSI